MFWCVIQQTICTLSDLSVSVAVVSMVMRVRVQLLSFLVRVFYPRFSNDKKVQEGSPVVQINIIRLS